MRDARSYVLCSVALASLLGCVGSLTPTVTNPPPNIIVVFGDDLAQWAVGAYGNPTVRTPNMDALSERGVVLENASSPSPVCSPSRASFFSGGLPSQHGIHDFLRESREYERDWLAGILLLPERLQRAGYRTALVGKWHLTVDAVTPYRGWDRWVSYDVWKSGWRNQYDHEGVVAFSNQGAKIDVAGPQSEYLTAQALDFIESRDRAQAYRERPYFLFLAPADTHAPFEGQPKRHLDLYREAEFTEVPRRETSPFPPAADRFAAPEDPSEMLRQYYAAVSMADEQLGKIVAALRRRGELETTLLVVTSDQGHMNGHHGLVGKSNASLPQNLYEEVLRVPMIVHWPAGLGTRGQRLDLPFDHLDLHQTLLDAAGIDLEAVADGRLESPGASLLRHLEDESTPWRRYRYSEHGTARTIADERYKLVRRYSPITPPFGDELYDLAEDPRESVNGIDDPAYRDVRIRLRRDLDRHFYRYEVPGRAGRLALEQPPTNGNEPWRRLAKSSDQKRGGT